MGLTIEDLREYVQRLSTPMQPSKTLIVPDQMYADILKQDPEVADAIKVHVDPFMPEHTVYILDMDALQRGIVGRGV